MLIMQRAAVALAVLLVASAAAGQTANKNPVPDEYAGTTMNLASGSNTRVSIQVTTWSSTSDRERVLSVIQRRSNDTNLPDVVAELAEVPTAGYIWTDGALGYAIKYAHRTTQPDRSERVVVVTDRPLGTWERSGRWKEAGRDAAAGPFTIVELHINRDGKGDGRMLFGTSFRVNDADKTVSVADDEPPTVTLGDVQRKPRPYWAGGS